LRRIEHGETAEAVCREVNISQATLYRWKQQYGALELDEVKELKALREENTQLKRVVADQALTIHVLKIVNAKKMVSPSQQRHAAQGVVAAGETPNRSKPHLPQTEHPNTSHASRHVAVLVFFAVNGSEFSNAEPAKGAESQPAPLRTLHDLRA
jgi:putative transposase